MRRRAFLYAALALAVPLPALALSGDDGGSGTEQVSISVSASLDGCGTAADTIVCKIDASWSDVPGAERYTASVTRADGSVVDFGEVGAGGSSFWVPYVGNGSYTVTVSAYGTPPGEERSRVVAKGSSDSAGGGGNRGGVAAPDPDATALEPTGAAPAGEPAPGEPEPDDEGDTCEETVPAPEEPPAETAPEPAATEDDTEASVLSAEAEATLSNGAELPESERCPATEAEPAP